MNDETKRIYEPGPLFLEGDSCHAGSYGSDVGRTNLRNIMIDFRAIKRIFPGSTVLGISEAMNAKGDFIEAEDLLIAAPDGVSLVITKYSGESYLQSQSEENLARELLYWHGLGYSEFNFAVRVEKTTALDQNPGSIVYPDFKFENLLI